jgi:phosphopantothenoylcysteine synthetase/decarboxylase
MIVANNVADTSIGFKSDNNSATIISMHETTSLPVASKRQVSVRIIESIKQHMDAMPTTSGKSPS